MHGTLTAPEPALGSVHCRPLRPADLRPAGVHLAEAFSRDPGILHLFPNAARRMVRATALMGYFLRLGQRYGTVSVAGDKALGAAVWFSAENARATPCRLLRSGCVDAPLRLGWLALRRLLPMMSALERARLRLMPERHWYLLVLGVSPACRGQGIGSALLGSMLERADAERVSCYLETLNSANLGLYRRHGFEVVSEARLPRRGLPFWCMARDPG